ncbi:MAG: protein TolR [Acidobacteria bacterium]|nr:protein TolR [Acidobacteriota bacterium]
MPKVQAVADPGPQRLGRRPRVASTLAEINVVPLVDVMLVLLVIFMITAPMIQRGVDVKLPVSRRAVQIEGERTLSITVPLAYRQDHQLFLGDERLPIDVLQERVRQRMQTATAKQVYLRGDGGVALQELMEIYDRLKDAGVESVGMVARAPGDR